MRLVNDDAWATMTIMQEMQGEPYSSKVGCAEVILRRTKTKYMSDGTVPGTVLWPMQFSGWNSHDATPSYRERIECAKVDDEDPVVQECIKAWKEALTGSNTTKGALLYYNPEIANPSWAKRCKVVAVVDNHIYLIEHGGT